MKVSTNSSPVSLAYSSGWFTRLRTLAGFGRILIWLAFAGVLYFGVYQPTRANIVYQDIYADAALNAINQGHPFHYAFVHASLIEAYGDLARFDRVPYSEPGLPIMLSVVSVVKGTLTGDATLDTSTSLRIAFGLFLFASLIIVLPGVRLAVSVAGLSTLALSLILGIINFWSAQRWATTFAAILVVMVIVVTVTYRRERWHLIGIACLGLLIGCLAQLREDSLILAYGAIGVLITGGIGIVGAAWITRIDSWRSYASLYLRRIGLTVLVFYGALFVVPFLVRGALSAAWHTSYSETLLPSHGGGHPLYLGLGYATNPYNIAWLDDIGRSQAELIAHENLFNQPAYQGVLLREWLQLVVHDPDTVIRGVQAKVEESSYWLQQNLPLTLPQEGLGALAASIPNVLNLLFIPAALINLTAFFWRKQPHLWIISLGTLALIGIALVYPLVIFPLYIFALRGVLIALTLLLPVTVVVTAPALNSNLGPFNRGRITQRLLMLTVGVGLVGVVVIGGWILWGERQVQTSINHLETSDPAPLLAAQEFRFGHTFNRLSIETQQLIIDQLLQLRHDLPVFVPATTNTEGFEIVLGVSTENQLHLIVRLPEFADPALMPKPIYGSINATYYFFTCARCSEFPTYLLNPMLIEQGDYPDDLVYQAINDRFWGENQYRMFSFLTQPAFANSDSLQVGLQRITGGGPDGLFGANFALENVSTQQVVRTNIPTSVGGNP